MDKKSRICYSKNSGVDDFRSVFLYQKKERREALYYVLLYCMKEKKKIKISDIIVDILLALALIVLGMSIFIAFKFKENPEDAYLFGYKPVYILTGSMEPTLREKGICIVQKTTYDDVDVDDIVMYTIEDKTITHRIVEKTEEGIRTKGDNNNVRDAYLLQEDNIKAKVVFIMNFTATIINDLQSGPMGYVKWIGYPVFVIIVLVVLSKLIKKIIKSNNKDEKDDDENHNTLDAESETKKEDVISDSSSENTEEKV